MCAVVTIDATEDSCASSPVPHRRKKPGRPMGFGDQQQGRYEGRNVVERCFNKLKQWRAIAMRSDTLARSYRAAVALAAR